MHFELTPALIEGILFCMENQNARFVVDAENSFVMDEKDTADADDSGGDRYIPIPEWHSSDGFHLMECFAAGFHNPLVRDALQLSLTQGKGVFRAFKAALSAFPNAEKHWFSFKRRRMRRTIVSWYNALREQWNMEKIGEEPDETEDLFSEDFIFRAYETNDGEAVKTLHNICRAGKPHGVGDPVLVVETARHEFAGFIAVKRKGTDLYICNLEVHPEYRGLGIGSDLCSRLIQTVKQEHVSKVYLDLPVEFEGFSRFLYRSSFKPVATRYCLMTDTLADAPFAGVNPSRE
ncbi:MAG: GNAT family N-acetyltransferase [Treponema sp.]|jgi:ribosomal protein S18 acetylase RimI-like enzyme|nr:GNAT family N-acetyltransferase [Treponema sp.]